MSLSALAARCCAPVIRHVRRHAVAHAAVGGLAAGIVGTPLVVHRQAAPPPAAFSRLPDADCARPGRSSGGVSSAALVPGFQLLGEGYGGVAAVVPSAFFGAGFGAGFGPAGPLGADSVIGLPAGAGILQGDVMQPVPEPSWGALGLAGAVVVLTVLP